MKNIKTVIGLFLALLFIVLFSYCGNRDANQKQQIQDLTAQVEDLSMQLLWLPVPRDTIETIVYKDRPVEVEVVKTIKEIERIRECPPGALARHQDEIAELKRDAKELFNDCQKFKTFYLKWKDVNLEELQEVKASKIVSFTKQFQGYTFFFEPRIRGELLSFDMRVSPELKPWSSVQEELNQEVFANKTKCIGVSAGLTTIDRIYLTNGFEYGTKKWSVIGQTHFPLEGGKMGYSLLGKIKFEL